jgi:hypothetical protein
LSAVAVASIALGLILLSIIVGVLLRAWLPEADLGGDSKEVIRLATALIGTMSAVVLALLFASTRTSFETTNASISQLTARIVELDHVLKEYGPEGEALRATLRQDVAAMIASIWREDANLLTQTAPPAPEAPDVVVLRKVRQLVPANPLQASLHASGLAAGTDLEKIRLTLLAQPPDSISKPFVSVLVLWLCFIFASFSMSAKANTTLITVLFICAFSASSAIYLILELGQPFDGLMQIPNSGLRHALLPLTIS